MKASLALEVRKSVPKELNLINFGFLDLAVFMIDDKFLISLPILLPLISLDTSRFFFLVLARVLWDSLIVYLLVVQSIEVSSTVISLKFLINLL